MRKCLLVVAAALSMTAVQTHAQVPPGSHLNGYLNVQKLTCGQLAGTFQEDADLLVAWYSGWYRDPMQKTSCKS